MPPRVPDLGDMRQFYLDKAEELLERAERAVTPEVQRELRSLAALYQRMADGSYQHPPDEDPSEKPN